MEEPLAGTDLRGLAALRAPGSGIRIAGGEMTRTFAETLAALDADAFDVYQPDVVLAGGMLRTRTVGELALARNRWFTPHTWTNGLGLLANLHVAAGVGGGPFIEFPYDPPGLDAGAPRRVPGRADPPRRRRHAARPALGPGSARSLDEVGDQAVRGMTATAPSEPTTADWLARAAAVQPRNEAFIDGRFVPAASGRTFVDVAGRDGSRITEVAEGGVEDVERAVAAARASFDDRRWADQSPGEPQARPAQARRTSSGRTATSWPCSSRSMSASRSATRCRSTSRRAAKTIQWYAETIDKVYGEVGPTGPDALSLVTREPIGVVAAIVPWNYPLIVTAWKLGAALATGNSVVLKPASAVAADAPCGSRSSPPRPGLPDGVLNVVPGPGRGARRRRSPATPAVDKIAFTGSTEVGKSLLRAVGGVGRQGHLARARRQEPAGRARRRRRPGGRGRDDRLGDLLQQRPDVQRRVAAHRPSLRPRGAGRAHRGDRSRAGTGRAARSRDAARLDRRRRQLEKVLGYVELGRREGARVVTGGERVREDTGGFYIGADDPRRRRQRLAGRPRGDLRAGPDRHRVRRRGRGAWPSPTTRRTGWRPGSGRATSIARIAWRARSGPGSSASTRSTRPTSPCRSVATSSRASGATSRSTRSTATPSSRRPGSTCRVT